MEHWIEIHATELTTTYAANLPNGVLIRCYSLYWGKDSVESTTFAPGLRVDDDGELLIRG